MIITKSDEHIEFKDTNGEPLTFVKFEGVDRIEGFIEETDHMVLSASDLIELAQWLLDRAKERHDEL